MNKQEWKEVNKIVDTALDLAKNKRSTYIQKRCQGDPEIQQKVNELLESIDRSGAEAFLEETQAYPNHLAADFSKQHNNRTASSLVGTTIGKYKIIELIGHGGMGSVYLTERGDGAYNKKVALKLLQRGMGTPSNIARFQRERNILANLDHPNIARLLDGGVTDNGLPYLVMEYIEGVPLLEYCQKHTLSLSKRLQLFKTVCEAVQHAHQNAIIHRDLKPGNIYVTGNGTVKVLDFGIAKLLKPAPKETLLFKTGTRDHILTLGYAAPEQFDGKTITTATDTYTLGILFYELLTGKHPFNIKDKNPSKIENLILREPPEKPSKKVKKLNKNEQTAIASHRNTNPLSVIQKLKGDLDAMAMKALRQEPEDRYLSTEQLLEDLDRYKRSLPLIAQRDTLQYRFKKFVKRNRHIIIAAILAIVTIIGFGLYHINTIEEKRHIAETEAQKAETVKDFLIQMFDSANPKDNTFEGKNLSAKELLVKGKNSISSRLNTQPKISTEVLLAIGNAMSNIDAFEEAETTFREALKKSASTARSLENKTQALVSLGNLEATRTNIDKAYQLALDANNNLDKISSPSTTLKASVFSLLGRLNVVKDNYEQANSYYEKAKNIYVNAGKTSSEDYIQMLTGYGKSLIYVFDFKKAEETLLKSNELYLKKYGKPTMTMAENYKFLAWTNREMGDFEASNRYFEKSIELKKQLAGKETISTALSIYHLSRNYTLMGNYGKSKELAKKVLSTFQQITDPPNSFTLRAKNYIAIANYNQSNLVEAQKLFTEVIAKYTKLNGENHMSVAGPSSHLAVVYQKMNDYQKAIPLLEKSIRINADNLGEESRGVGVDMLKLAVVYRGMGNYEEAQNYFRQVKSIFSEEVPKNHYREGEFYFQYAKLKRDLNQYSQAQKYFQQAFEVYRDNFGRDNKLTKKVRSYIAQSAEVSFQ
ncbi:serine/threonine-protein kinase [Fodinibius halophilus]|uniref:Tetratricopeptide repeat protein n=1 Tax=Fodinibius halophilus TaxID=1736908 RepID=A0A6M1TGI1_9BACT|nr:serine/threonine-protein kinase [Fodinibius halophilus]NGP87760.1 tetratricopeptide repeat protein [Fodinibius halophilus]